MVDLLPGLSLPLASWYRDSRDWSSWRPAGVARRACNSFSRYRTVFFGIISRPLPKWVGRSAGASEPPAGLSSFRRHPNCYGCHSTRRTQEDCRPGLAVAGPR